MKRGDLIQFRLNFPYSNSRARPWSDPALVMYQEDPEGYPPEEVGHRFVDRFYERAQVCD